jgi:hypothetical protein
MIVFRSRSKSSRLALRSVLYLAAVTVIGGAPHPLASAQTNRPKTTRTTPPTTNFRGPPLPSVPLRQNTPPRPLSPSEAANTSRPAEAANNSRVEEYQRQADEKRLAERAELERKQQKRKQYLEMPAPPFDRASAPAPLDCFKAYVTTVRNASSMEQLLGYLSQSKQNLLDVEQAEYDPKAQAEKRRWYQRNNPEAREDVLNVRFSSPYDKALRDHKAFVDDILEIRDLEVKGNTAKVSVKTVGGKGMDGKHYAYSWIFVEMVGEGNSWKVKDYRKSPLLFGPVDK